MNKQQSDDRNIEFVRECVEKYRSRLLDTTKRNSLISFNHSERSRQHIRIIDELPDFLYGEFLDGKMLSFLALPEEDQVPPDERKPIFRRLLEQAKLTDDVYKNALDSIDEDEEGALDEIKEIERQLRNRIRVELALPVWEEQQSLSNADVARKYGLDPSYELPEPTIKDQNDPARHVDKFVQTLLKPEEMARKLTGLNSYIRSDIEESGVNTLYAAFGFLQWYESENADKPCLAPLLLLQLEMEKRQSKEGYVFRVQATGEEPEINLSISERLRSDFGIELPEFAGEDGAEAYMAKVSNLIKEANVPNKEKWRVRRFVTIGRFRFSRLVMFHDLNEKKWPKGHEVASKDIVQSLFSGAVSDDTGAGHAEDYDIDTPEVEEAVPLLITSADASQHSALVDVMKGKNLVIKGPPGTGKSQTITNIIANALAKGKTVLFLAEKMAALNVVHERLSKAGLGPYCLELHSTKSKKSEILKSIEDRLKLPSVDQSGGYLASKLEEFNRHKGHITEYIDVLNSKFGRQDRSVHSYLWGAQLRKDRLGDLLPIVAQIKVPFREADLTDSELTAHTDALRTIVALKKNVISETVDAKHPWCFVTNFSLNPFQQDEFKQHIDRWQRELQELQVALDAFSELYGVPCEQTADSLKFFLDESELLSHWVVNGLDLQLLCNLEDRAQAANLVAFVESVHRYRSSLEEVKSLKDPISTLCRLETIEIQAEAAKQLGAEHSPAEEIKKTIRSIEDDLVQWSRYSERLLSLGGRFGVSDDDEIDKICKLAGISEYIASIPREYLLHRNKAVVNEANAALLKNAFEAKKRVDQVLAEQETNFDLALFGPANEIRIHAASLENSGFFSFLDPAFRRAKKLFNLASKHKKKFVPSDAAGSLRIVAEVFEERRQIDGDVQLQALFGSQFAGVKTDFEKFSKVNDWAAAVRKRYAAGDEFARTVRQWLLFAEMEELDEFLVLEEDQNFIEFRKQVLDQLNQKLHSIPLSEYLLGLEHRAVKLRDIERVLVDLVGKENVSFSDVINDIPHLKNASASKEIAEITAGIEGLFGENYSGVNTNIEGIEKTARFLADFLSVSDINECLHLFLNTEFGALWRDFVANRENIKRNFVSIQRQAEATQEQSGLNLSTLFEVGEWTSITFEALISLFQTALEHPDSLSSWVDLNSHISKAAQDIKGDLLVAYDRENLDYGTLPLAFEYMTYSSNAREIYKLNPVISSVNGSSLSQARARIKNLDEEITELQQTALTNALTNARPLPGIGSGRKSGWTEGALLNNEVSKQRRHIAVRDLMKRAGISMQKLKPCFLMSPLTVAQYLEPEKLVFDLVVIDEASQMRPEDALGAAARANQIVVVGDPQQLPPTSFFQSAGYNDEDEEEDFAAEAIMDMALSSFRPSRILSRHYRSQHESLIAFSNYHFYDSNLVLFPSPIKNRDELGVRLEYVGGTYSSNSNMEEAQAVVQAALEFMRKHPDRSLGIATMNQVQKDLIELEMDRVFIEYPHAARYKDLWQPTLEGFFVKNLESVQGDERDAIFISTVYGPDKNGTVMQRFGPINRAGGHRRLNVLFTRAKKNMVVFTSLKPENIKVSENSSLGLKALRGFLSYASKGVLDEGTETHREPDSDFEIWVKEKLEGIGCEVHPQVGVAGYRIDLGIKHPNYPYGYLLGIECDGATYHSSKSVRERDVIRQQVLEGLGWRIYRIWSTDWFSNPVREFEKLKQHIDFLLSEERGQSIDSEGDFDINQSYLSTDTKSDDLEERITESEEPRVLDEKRVQLFDSVTYFMLKESGKREKRTVQIVPTHGDPDIGTIAQHSAIGRALLGATIGEELECTLPIGEVTIEVVNIDAR